MVVGSSYLYNGNPFTDKAAIWWKCVTGGFPHKGQWRGALKFSLIRAWISDWANNRDEGNLRRHRAHYDVTIMWNGLTLNRICHQLPCHLWWQSWHYGNSRFSMPMHYSDVIMGAMESQITGARVFTQPFVQGQIKENIKALRHWPSWEEFTGDRWIPARGR